MYHLVNWGYYPIVEFFLHYSKVKFIEYLIDKGLTEIAEAVKNDKSEKLSDAQRQKLIDAAGNFKFKLGFTPHKIDVGFSGPSPRSGEAGRFIDIID